MRKVLALVLALVVGGGIALGVTASQAGASSEFTVVGHETNIEFVTAQGGASTAFPTSPLVPGDRLLVRSDLTQNGTAVGYQIEEYTLTFNGNSMAEVIIALTNRGDLHTSALVRPGPGALPVVWDAVVDGGTFAFRNAHGSAHTVRLPNNDRATTFALG